MRQVKSQESVVTGKKNGRKNNFHKMLDALPMAIYTTDAKGNLTYFNQAAIEFSGRTPELGTDKWCVTWKLYYPDGSHMPHEECPMAVALKEGRSDFGHEAIAERPDGKRIWFMPYPSPLFDDEGNITGGINMFIDISDRKRDEQLQNDQNRLLELIASGASLKECLTLLCNVIPKLSAGVRAAVLPVDITQKTFKCPVAPDLNTSFKDELEGTNINDPNLGIYGIAVCNGIPAQSMDIRKKDEWVKKVYDLSIENNIIAIHSTPVFDDKKNVIASFILLFDESRKPYKWEYQLAEFGAHVANIALERDRSRQKLQEREEKYRTLFESMDEGYCIIQLKFDENNKAVDYTFLEINPSFAEQSGLKDVEGKSMRELVPDHEEFWFETYGEVALKRKPVRFEHEAGALNRFFDVYAFPFGEEGSQKVAILFKDINHRKQDEQKLRRSEEKYRTLFETMDEGFGIIQVIFDENDEPVDYKVTEVNPAAEKLLGLKNLEDKTPKEVLPEYEGFSVETYGKVVQTRETVRFEKYLEPFDRYYSVSAHPYRKQKERKVAIYFNDITEQKKDQQTNAHLGAVVNNSDDAIISKDLNGIILSWNKAAQNLFGYTEDEVIGESITMIIPKDRLEEEDEILDKISRGGRFDHFETVRKCKDGTLVNVAETISPIRDSAGKIVGASKIARDITKRKKTRQKQEQLLREVETEREHLLDVFKNAPSMMATTEGPDHVFSQANSLYKQLTGFRDLIGKPVKEALPEVEDQGFIKLLDQVYETGQSVRRSGERVILKLPDGGETEEYFLDFVYQPISNSEGSVTGIFIQAVDLTERKRQEKELLALNESLEERVERRTSSLISYQKQLRSLAMQLSRAEEEERSRLAAELHDNLGQMLAVIKMKMDFIQKEKSFEDLSSAAQLVDDSIQYTRKLMSDLKPPPSLKGEKISAAIKWIIRAMNQYDLNIHFNNKTKKEPSVNEDIQATIVQAVRELLFNVVKHADSNEARIRLSFPDNKIKIMIEDNGKGFDVNNTNFAVTQNGGFGLFHIKERLDVLGGRTKIESERGEGTKVTLIAPLKVAQEATGQEATGQEATGQEATGQEATGQEATKVEKAKMEPIKVLLVDDHKMIREGLRNIIDNENDLTVIDEAADAETAIAAVQQAKPDVIIMDINLPGMNGIEATKIIKDENPGIRIIGLSFHDDEEVRQKMYDAGASAYLEKANASQALCAAIRNKGMVDELA